MTKKYLRNVKMMKRIKERETKTSIHIFSMDWCKRIIVTVKSGKITEEIRNDLFRQYPDYKIDIA